MSIGLKIGTVAVEQHKVKWELLAEETIQILKEVLKEDLIDAQHIGSTAIKKICAKPIIDIVVGVSSFDKIFKHNDELAQRGIVYRREDHPGQHLYVSGELEKNIQTHYIHVVIWGQASWNNYINMRDYLNAHEDKAMEYSKLKEYLAEKFPEDRIAYTNGKSDFIEDILRSANNWKMQQQRE